MFFADDAFRTRHELVCGESSEVIERRLENGRAHRAVKVPHTPESLEERLDTLGWQIRVHSTSGPFFWGEGRSRGGH